MRRLRGLHDGSAAFDGVATVTVDGAAAETVGRDDPRIGAGGVPADRVAAAAWSAFDEATVVTLDGTPAGPVTITVTGPGEGAVAVVASADPHHPARRGDGRAESSGDRARSPTTWRSCWPTARG